MDLGATKLWIANPTAEMIQPGLEAAKGEIAISDRLNFFSDHVTEVEINCAKQCEEQVYTITFADVDFGDCNECGKTVGFTMIVRRKPDFDIDDYLHVTTRLSVSYEPNAVPSGVVTAATFATWFADFFDNGAYDDEHDFFGVTAVASGADLILTVPCPTKLDIYPEEGGELIPAQIVETTPGEEAYLTKAQMQKLFPLGIGYVMGQGPDETFTGCQDVCIIDIRGCIPTCVEHDKDLLHTENAVHLHEVGTKFWYQIIVDSSAEEYSDFVTALNAVLPPTIQIPFDVANTSLSLAEAVVGGSNTVLDLATLATVTADTFDSPISGSISNGAITLEFENIATIADLVTALNTAYPTTPVSFGDATTGDNLFEVIDATPFATTATGPITLLVE